MVPKRVNLREVKICALVVTFTEWCSESALGIGLGESELALTLSFWSGCVRSTQPVFGFVKMSLKFRYKNLKFS